jgi:antitoxin (DNA-binding transcriptional repressor) of toxin-antitoxin stability system
LKSLARLLKDAGLFREGASDPPLDIVRSRGYLAMMRTVALKTLEGQVREHVHLAEKGETVLITDDQDRVIAELAPSHREACNPFADNPALAEAVRKGWITPASVISDEPPPRLPIVPLKALLKDLDNDRSDR